MPDHALRANLKRDHNSVYSAIRTAYECRSWMTIFSDLIFISLRIWCRSLGLLIGTASGPHVGSCVVIYIAG